MFLPFVLYKGQDVSQCSLFIQLCITYIDIISVLYDLIGNPFFQPHTLTLLYKLLISIYYKI